MFPKSFFRSLTALGLLVLCAVTAQASEIRVDATGGLTTVIDDETNNLSLFNDLNPAGLMLLKTRDRFDITGQWYDQLVTGGTAMPSYSLVPRLSDDGNIRYGGLMFFPDPHWALQVAGDMLFAPNQAWYLDDARTQGRYRSMLRGAVKMDALSLGLELYDAQFDHTYAPGVFKNNVGITSGSSSENELKLRAGAILRLAGGEEADSTTLDLGGIFMTHLGPDVENLSEDLFTAATPFTLTQAATASQYNVFGPELLYQVPGSLIVRFTCLVTDLTTNFNQDFSVVTAAFPYLNNQYSNHTETIDPVGAVKLILPTGGGGNVRLGANMEVVSTYTIYQNPAQFIYSDKNTQQINGRLGVALENPGHSLWGFQFVNRNSINNSQSGLGAGTYSATASDFDYYRFTLGGEQNLAPAFFLDAGFTAEFDIFYGSGIPDAWAPTLTFGPRIEEKGFKWETKFLLGETLDLAQGNIEGTQLGAAVNFTCFL